MKIRMIKQTFWEGKPLQVGDTPEVEDHVAIRWLAKRIAEEIEDLENPPLTPSSTGENVEKEKKVVKTLLPSQKKGSVNAGKKLSGVIKKHDARVSGGAD
jgi:hypothetical protein